MPTVLDICCGAGGASMGYAQAGFTVTGVDYRPQPRYPFEFIQADALEVLRDTAFVRKFDFVHTSFPCQFFKKGTMRSKRETFDLLTPGRPLLIECGVPWVMENVMDAPMDLENSIVLCANDFGLRTYRHRRFEYPPEFYKLTAPKHKTHLVYSSAHRSRLHWDLGYHRTFTGGGTYEKQGPMETFYGPPGMGIDWMTRFEVTQSIPPAYTKYIGLQVIDQLFN